MFQARMRVAIDVEGLPMHVARAAQREMQHAGGDCRVADLVDQNEAAQFAAGLIGLEYQRFVGG